MASLSVGYMDNAKFDPEIVKITYSVLVFQGLKLETHMTFVGKTMTVSAPIWHFSFCRAVWWPICATSHFHSAGRKGEKKKKKTENGLSYYRTA
jgi:hypothetical protein